MLLFRPMRWQRNKKLKQPKQKWLKKTKRVLLCAYFSQWQKKSLLVCILDAVLHKFSGIEGWEHHNSPTYLNKLIMDTEFTDYLRSTNDINGVGYSSMHRMKFLCWNMKIWAYKIICTNIHYFIIVMSLLL